MSYKGKKNLNLLINKCKCTFVISIAKSLSHEVPDLLSLLWKKRWSCPKVEILVVSIGKKSYLIVGKWDSTHTVSRTHNCHYITAVDRLHSWVPLGWGQCHCQPEDASLACVPPADEFTAGNHHWTIEVNSLVLDGGVLGSKAASRGLSLCAVSFSLN